MKTKFFLILFSLLHLYLSLNNGLGQTPPMGWNSWNKFACEIDEELIKSTAEALISTGLAAKGYTYVNLDDCWQIARDENNSIVADGKKFPSGMKGLADFLHSKNLKFGVYSDSGFYTCQKRPGSLNLELLDAQSYASWEVDYLKYDNCYNDGASPKLRYPPMRDALNKTGRPIFFSMCEWGEENPATWAGEVGNSWRTTGDISDNWDSFIKILDLQVGLEKYAGPGHWNDPDMLEVGNGGMNQSEYEAQFALWALLKAPLLIGCDVRNINPETLVLLGNEEIIAINQDRLGVQGKRVQKTGDQEVWAGPLENNEIAVVLFNRGSSAATILFDFFMVGLKGNKAAIRDLLNHKDLGVFDDHFSAQVESHSAVVLRLKNSLDSKKKTFLQEFISITSCPEQTALNILRSSQWDIDSAFDTFFSNPQKDLQLNNESNYEDFYIKYKEEGSDNIGQEGIERFCEDLGISPLDPLILVISYLMGAKEMGVFTKNEFITGMREIMASDMATLKRNINFLEEYLNQDEKFKKVYTFAFDFAKEKNIRGLNFITAKELWKVFFKKKYPNLQMIWDEFLEKLPKKNDITKDQWLMYYEFLKFTKGDIKNYREDEAWPVLIDDFVEYFKSKK